MAIKKFLARRVLLSVGLKGTFLEESQWNEKETYVDLNPRVQ
jgi:hypothetical protein